MTRAAKQSWKADVYRRNARYVSELAGPILEILDPKPGEHILDLGCGDGVLTRRLADLGCHMTGGDASPDLVQAAVVNGVHATVMDARELDHDARYDAVFSNAVLHWIREADEVISRVSTALKPGGRFVAECGGHRCIEAIRLALVAELDARGYDGSAHDPWYFPSAEEYGDRLRGAGFVVDNIAVVPRPTPLPGGMAGFIETFGGSFVSALPEGEWEGYVGSVVERLEPTLRSDDGSWTADYTRLRFAARKPV